jgi:hypothetical protein
MAWAWKGSKANVKERVLSSMQAINEGRMLVCHLAKKMIEAGGSERDLTVLLFFAEREHIGKVAGEPRLFSANDPEGDSGDLEAALSHQRDIPVGFVVCALDRANKEYIVHIRPLILQKPAMDLLNAMADKAAKLTGWRPN